MKRLKFKVEQVAPNIRVIRLVNERESVALLWEKARQMLEKRKSTT